MCRPRLVRALSILARSSFLTCSKARYCSVVLPTCKAVDSEFTAFRVSKMLIYGRMLTAGSPSFNDISAVDGLDEADLDEADFVEILWSGTQLESPKIADIALVC